MNLSRASLELSFSTGVTPLSQAWRAAADKSIPRALGISHALAWPLIVIHNSKGPLRQTELASLLGIANSSVVRLIDQLCAASLVERSQDSDDRRANTLKLTKAGEDWSKTLEAEVAKFRAAALAEVSSDDLATCLQVFQQIKRNVVSGSEALTPTSSSTRGNTGNNRGGT